MVSPARTSARASSSPAKCRTVSPIAHKGASCTSRKPDSVTNVANNARAATDRVSTFSAPVIRKVRSKIASDSALACA